MPTTSVQVRTVDAAGGESVGDAVGEEAAASDATVPTLHKCMPIACMERTATRAGMATTPTATYVGVGEGELPAFGTWFDMLPAHCRTSRYDAPLHDGGAIITPALAVRSMQAMGMHLCS
ncbi:MAG: hypothetical protein EOO41_02700, partial [Methanobacteriota archaeon]